MKKKKERKKEESRDQNSPKAFGELKIIFLPLCINGGEGEPA